MQQILTESLGVSRRMIQKLTRSGGILVNGRKSYLRRQVRTGDVVAARLAMAEEPVLEPVAMPLDVVYEDEDLLVVNKAAGVLVHPLGRGGAATLAHGVAHHFRSTGVRARVRPVHRLDRETSGLLVFAKSAIAQRAVDRQMHERELRRTYVGFAEGVPEPPSGIVDAPIGRHSVHPHLREVVSVGGDPALTLYRIVESYGDVAALLELELQTGRTHQIRVHLSHLGHPLLGDVQYGGKRWNGLNRQALHATRLSLRQPSTGVSLELSAPLPEDLQRLRETLRGG